MFHKLHFHGARGKGQEITSSAPFLPLFHRYFYSLAPCTLPIAPYETERAKVELIIDFVILTAKLVAKFNILTNCHNYLSLFNTSPVVVNAALRLTLQFLKGR